MAKYERESSSESVTLPLMTADEHNYSLGVGNLFRLSSDAVRKITGIDFDANEVVRLVNVGEFSIILQNEHPGSNPENRIVTGNGADVILTPDDTAVLSYDSISNMWRLMA